MINGTTFCPALFCSHIQAADEIQMVEQDAVKYPAFNRSEYFWQIKNYQIFCQSFHFESTRVAEVVQRHEGPSPKSLELDENLKP